MRKNYDVLGPRQVINDLEPILALKKINILTDKVRKIRNLKQLDTRKKKKHDV